MKLQTLRRGTAAAAILTMSVSLAACGSDDDSSNTDVDRNEQECGTAEDSADCADTEGPSTQTSESEG